jgi:hypothetical protein
MQKKLFIALVATAAVAGAQELPKAETLFEKFIEVTGGKAAYEKRRTEVGKGVVKMTAAGVSGTVEIYSAAPNSQVIIMDVQGVGKIEQGTDGINAWENSAVMGPRVKSGQEKAEALQEAVFNAPIQWQKLYTKVETTAAETAEGVECFKVVATPRSGGKPETFWFDRNTGLTVKVKKTTLTSLGEVSAELVAKNFQNAGGILQPMTLLQRAGGQEVIIEMQTLTPNVVIPKSRFNPPAEVQQLMGTPAAKPVAPAKKAA